MIIEIIPLKLFLFSFFFKKKNPVQTITHSGRSGFVTEHVTVQKNQQSSYTIFVEPQPRDKTQSHKYNTQVLSFSRSVITLFERFRALTIHHYDDFPFHTRLSSACGP